MDSKIIGLIAGSFLLTGCISAKVEQLHDATTKLTTSVDKYVVLTNKIVDYNDKYSIYIDGNKDLSLGINISTPIEIKDQKEEDENNSRNFNRIFINQYINYSLGEDIKQQSAQLSEYFKILPKSLESENINENFNSLVENIDQLNKIIEGKLRNNGDVPQGNLTTTDKKIIDTFFKEAYQIHQYKQFDKIINDQYEIILQAIINIMNYTNYTLTPVAKNLNSDFENSHKSLLKSFAKQQKQATKSPAKTAKANYSIEDLKKIEQLLNQPMVANSSLNYLAQESPLQERSKLYTKFCPSNLSSSKYYTIKWYISDNKNSQYTDYSFDFKNILYMKGREPNCELIDILGLLLERKYKQIDLSKFEKKTSDLDKVVDFLMNKIPSDKKEK
ncbi:hypothetical protein ABFY81_08895 [Acinetobacter sp. WA-87]|uniref:hypothetical protein n=1 Tax=Acinetobacter sp. WA-87 TaxID=3153556 RepID=UPI00326675D7